MKSRRMLRICHLKYQDKIMHISAKTILLVIPLHVFYVDSTQYHTMHYFS